MKFTQQVELFADSSLIIGHQGTGLHNMIFAEDAKIIEIFPRTV